jgi:hypothetical protein
MADALQKLGDLLLERRPTLRHTLWIGQRCEGAERLLACVSVQGVGCLVPSLGKRPSTRSRHRASIRRRLPTGGSRALESARSSALSRERGIAGTQRSRVTKGEVTS